MNKVTVEHNIELRSCITAKQAWHYRIIPDHNENNRLRLLIDRSRNINGIKNELQIITGKAVELEDVESSYIEENLVKFYPQIKNHTHELSIQKLLKDKDSLIISVISEALGHRSSDIHFETLDKKARIRFRIDGLLVDKYVIPYEDYPAIVNTIKIKADLDIAEKRLPQDGRISYQRDLVKMDIRVSVIPTIHGEKIVMRLLNKDTSHIDLESVGFEAEQLEAFRRSIEMSHGIILISGPTGSGKTTTLYATLKRLNEPTRNILTIEDPIEYTLDGINQVQLKESIGLTFPAALRTFLRQDPDIIMVGEIRDPETAGIAIRAALTGHLVLSTIHTNSALGIISRLVDMGIQNYLISGTLNVAVAQRLVRVLCPHCKKENAEQNSLFHKFFSQSDFPQFEPVGCDECNFTGFKGRKAIFEIIEIDSELRESIRTGNLESDFLTRGSGFKTLSDQSKKIFREGLTSFHEILPILLNE